MGKIVLFNHVLMIIIVVLQRKATTLMYKNTICLFWQVGSGSFGISIKYLFVNLRFNMCINEVWH